jgi:ABC-type phosphate/phosphonate transport system ATPase subunit
MMSWIRVSKFAVGHTCILQKLNKQGHTIILVTHETDISQYTKRIVTFRDGRIIVDEEQDRGARDRAVASLSSRRATAPKHGAPGRA